MAALKTKRFIKIGSATELVRSSGPETSASSAVSLIDKCYIYKLLNNRVYVGEAVHKGTSYPGEHQAIIDRALWDSVRDILRESPQRGLCTHARRPRLC